MKPDFVPESVWELIPEEKKEALLLECGRRFRLGLDRETAFQEACDRVLADEVWAFLGLDDFQNPVHWMALVDRDLKRRHATFLRALELYCIALSTPKEILKLRDDLEEVFYLSELRAAEGDCPNCGFVLSDDGEKILADETVHKMCAEEYARVRQGVAERLVDYCRNTIPEDEWDEAQVVEEEEVEVEPLPEFLGVFDDLDRDLDDDDDLIEAPDAAPAPN